MNTNRPFGNARQVLAALVLASLGCSVNNITIGAGGQNGSASSQTGFSGTLPPGLGIPSGMPSGLFPSRPAPSQTPGSPMPSASSGSPTPSPSALPSASPTPVPTGPAVLGNVGTFALIPSPYLAGDVIVDSLNNVFATNSYTAAMQPWMTSVFKIVPSGQVTSYVSGLLALGGIGGDALGNGYVGANSRVYRVSPPGNYSVVAGKNTSGYQDGLVASALVTSAYDTAVDANGNLYFTDSVKHTVRKLTPEGMVATVAGLPGSSGYQDGMGSAARFKNPNGMAVDLLGNVYVTDDGGTRIRKITPAGQVTTYAGNGVLGYQDGAASTAQFKGAAGLAFDLRGNLYVADRINYRIRMVSPDGIVSTIAGSGTPSRLDGAGTAATFYNPTGVAFDYSGTTLYVADWDCIRVIR